MLIKYRYPIQEPEKSLQTMMCLYRTKKKIYKHSWCVHVKWNPLEPVGTRSDLLRFQSTQWIIFYFSIFIFSPLPPNFPPSSPYSFFVFIWGRGGGGGGEGNGQGTATAPGGSHHHHRRPVGRSPPLRRGGGQSPPPLLHQTKKQTNKIYKSNDISTLDNKNNILWIRKINANYNSKL